MDLKAFDPSGMNLWEHRCYHTQEICTESHRLCWEEDGKQQCLTEGVVPDKPSPPARTRFVSTHRNGARAWAPRHTDAARARPLPLPENPYTAPEMRAPSEIAITARILSRVTINLYLKKIPILVSVSSIHFMGRNYTLVFSILTTHSVISGGKGGYFNGQKTCLLSGVRTRPGKLLPENSCLFLLLRFVSTQPRPLICTVYNNLNSAELSSCNRYHKRPKA